MPIHTLIVAEKPSTGKAIANAIGANRRESGYLHGNGYAVTWAFGHLLTSAKPQAYDAKYNSISPDVLPIIPTAWKFELVEEPGKRKQFELIKQLMNKPEVKEIISATDAAREGELIFRLIYNHANCKKPVKRLWISSLEPQTIQKGLIETKPSVAFDNLFYAALCRTKADWIFGMNMTCLYTSLYGGKGNVINIGRVQTPTINMIVERQKSIDNHIPKTYYLLTANCNGFQATTKANTLNQAHEIVQRCNGRDAFVTKMEKKTKRENPPHLYDLTTLQREANRSFGYSASETLEAAQKLYEKALISYPRTDSRYLPSDLQEPASRLILSLVEKEYPYALCDLYARESLNLDKSVDNSKVTDHHAIIPTESVINALPEGLNDAEANILSMVCFRLIVASSQPHSYEETHLVLDIEGEAFTAMGRTTLEDGFTALINAAKKQDNMIEQEEEEAQSNVIPSGIQEGATISHVEVHSQEKQTKPPKPYTEGMLLSDMERAGMDIADSDLKDIMRGLGIGTPATRAAIIEGTLTNKYVIRKGNGKTKTLHPTEKAYTLMQILNEDLKSAELTAHWEKRLQKVSEGQISERDFVSEIEGFVSKYIKGMQALPLEMVDRSLFADSQQKPSIGKCPSCQSNVFEGPKTFYCEKRLNQTEESSEDSCGFMLYKDDYFFTNKGKTLSAANAAKLLAGKTIKLTGCKPRDSAKKPYDIKVSMEIKSGKPTYSMDFLDRPIKEKTR